MSEDTSKGTKILIAVIIGLILGLCGVGYFAYKKTEESNANKQENELNKQQLEDQYEMLTVQYEGFKMNMKNDSLLIKLDSEQAKVQRLLEELKSVKAENRVEIARLNKELATLQKVLKSYVVQIDSLNKANELLRKENKEITDKYHQTTQTLSTVKQEKENLTDRVSKAAKLDATSVSILATNNKGKVQKKIDKIERLAVNFSITKNITAEPGERIIYVRIMKPDDDVLVKSRANVFKYENKEINYSMKRIIEYGGEEVSVSLYWEVEEYLMPGNYRADIFADGNRIGSKSFTLEK